jgi:hypothetical protein
MAQTLDLRAPFLIIKFDKGKTLKPVFYCLGSDNSVVNLTGYTARMQARINSDDASTVLSLTTENSGLSIVTGTATLSSGATVANSYGVKLNVDDSVTAAITWGNAYFDIELIDTSGDVLPFVKGQLIPYAEVTR